MSGLPHSEQNIGRDLKTAPHSQIVSIFSGGIASPLTSHAADILIGTQLIRDRSDAITHDENKPMRSVFLLCEDQNDGLVMRTDAVAKSATNRPTHTAVLIAFQFDFENGTMAIPMASHVTKYCMNVFQSSNATRVV